MDDNKTNKGNTVELTQKQTQTLEELQIKITCEVNNTKNNNINQILHYFS